MNAASTWKQALGTLKPLWDQRSPREQTLLRLSAVTLLMLVLWRLALAPALQTWQEAPTRQARLDSQNQTMWQLKAQAQDLQKPKSMTRSESIQWLQSNVDDLGPDAKVSLQGDRALLSLHAAPAEALAYWITSAREHALAAPVQAQLQQNTAQATKTHTTNTHDTVWQGTVLLRLP